MCTITDGSCQNGASRDTSFHYSLQNLPNNKPQFTPGSTASNTRTVYGHSFTGYSVLDHQSYFVYHWQRPALLNVSDHYNRDYNGVCNTEVFHFQYLLANVHTISVILYMRVSFLCISSFLGSAIARFLLDIK